MVRFTEGLRLYPGKANVVADALSRKSIGFLAAIKGCQRTTR